MTDNGRTYDYPAEVRLEIGDQSIEDYAYAADVLNDGRYDVVSLQHEFGIFGGEAGDHILTLLNRLSIPWSRRCIRSCRNLRASKGL